MFGSKEPCKFWPTGSCKFGTNCKFAHIGPGGSKPGGGGFGGGGFGQQNTNRFSTFNQGSFEDNASSASFQSRKPNKFGGGAEGTESLRDTVINDMKCPPIWPFTCYGHERNAQCCISGDISPDEVRWEAYQAAKTGTMNQHLATLNSVAEGMRVKRETLMKNPDIVLGSGSGNSFGSSSGFGSPGAAFGGSLFGNGSGITGSNLFSGGGSLFGQGPTVQPSVFGSTGGFGQSSGDTMDEKPTASGGFGTSFGSGSLGSLGGSMSGSMSGSLGGSMGGSMGGSTGGSMGGSMGGSVFGSSTPSPMGDSLFGKTDKVGALAAAMATPVQSSGGNLTGGLQAPPASSSGLSEKAVKAFSSAKFSFRGIPEEEPTPEFVA